MSRTFRRLIAAFFVLLLALLLLLPRLSPGRAVPVLLYHHLAEETDSDLVVTPARFRAQMTALKRAGFTTVTVEQMQSYVTEGAPLPRKPVLITFDDGYASNLTLAAPILEELGLCATVFVIGINEGEQTYVHTGEPLTPPRFSYAEAAPWVEKGVLDLQCHTFDMHQLPSYGVSGREGMLPLPGEDDARYREALKSDLTAFRRRREGQVPTELTALAYPFGYYSAELDRALAELGVALTFTTEELCSRLQVGQPESMRLMGRFNVTEGWSGARLALRLHLASIDIPALF